MFQKILIANRGEIAIRIARAAADLGIPTVAIYSEDDAGSLHRLRADTSRELRGVGPSAYLDSAQLVSMALECGCDAIHPGYGFLSESADFARQARAAGLSFVGPSPEVLDVFGNKAATRDLARALEVDVAAGSYGPTTLDQAAAILYASNSGAVMIKAMAGGGGRGMRKVSSYDELASAYKVCREEALLAFGYEEVYVEEFVPSARHIEVQVIADQAGNVVCLGERDCSLQRRHQKVVEIAPAPDLAASTRSVLARASERIAKKAELIGLATFEFLVSNDSEGGGPGCLFIECNPRLQVEHTVTETVYGIDLVQLQIQTAAGMLLPSLGLDPKRIPKPTGFAIELRVNMEKISGTTVMPSGGMLTAFEPPMGPGIRVDTFGYRGYRPSPNFDSLLAKVIVHGRNAELSTALRLASRALEEFRVEGIATNLHFLRRLVAHPDVAAAHTTTAWIEENWVSLVGDDLLQPRHFALAEENAEVESTDIEPLGGVALHAPMHGRVVSIDAGVGDAVSGTKQLIVLEAMKMHNSIAAGTAGTVAHIRVKVGDMVAEGEVLLTMEPGIEAPTEDVAAAETDTDVSSALAAVLERRYRIQDDARPEAVAKRHALGRRTPRENIEDLCDDGSFLEFGSLATSSVSRLRDPDRAVPADGLIAGFATINASLYGDKSRCVVLAFDPTVFAGTMGMVARLKLERLIRLATEGRLPIILFAEGGGARSGESDGEGAASSLETFSLLARAKGQAPLVGIVAGYCFAANAALVGCCDVIIATRDASLGMAGPAMIEGAGLGRCRPEDVGPAPTMSRNGVIDVLVSDEIEAVAVAKQYLGFFQGDRADWNCADQRKLRNAVPPNRVMVYDVRNLLRLMADADSLLEMRASFGRSLVTALIRVEGLAFGVLANDPRHLGGAIDSDAADKAARFVQLCDRFQLPIVSLCDTPGFMVGPEAERTALVRHVVRMMVAGSGITTPHFSVVVRKCFGLGGLAMNLGSHQRPLFHVAWPTGEYGAMNPEGSVRIAHRQELEALESDAQRAQRVRELTDAILERGGALRAAERGAMDEVIDPADTREWLAVGIRSMRMKLHAPIGTRSIDTW